MKTLLTILIITMIFLVGCEKEQTVGGDVDEHGCMISAGYSWCEEKTKCLRAWEESCELEKTEDELKALNVTQNYVSEKGIEAKIVDASAASCPGFWDVEIEYENGSKATAILNNWQVVSVKPTGSPITNFMECAAAGNPVMESYPRQCRADGQTFVEEIEEPIR